ncbi:MAG: 50S ribosomal protein L20 [Candidatus Levybacteria bacterium RIFCSPHIGHO2_01_FULL_37_17]|nr:MAG: 50S ribosomal protein L20 [Candidatus Levybacteria bacterium RIFCSPHIGHO2_01_FULL_37_17]OGH36773.1 MAG: 50S ribosomal protein L20 [Candidatus Levybacteria bacterium RIFCSPLOWO2_01_FULL_38_23]
MRVKRGIVSRRKHNKLAEQTRGYRGTKHRLVKTAKEALLHAGAYAYHGRKIKKRDIRALWITRIGEAAKLQGISYSALINKLKNDKIELDRKILADLVVNDPETFKKIVTSVK